MLLASDKSLSGDCFHTKVTMCPPASSPPATALGDMLTDESICKCLMQLKSGHSLPDNILSDVDPYQYLPSNLPGTWYFCSGKKRDSEMELWKSTGEACEVYSTPAVSGCRKTLEFYKDGQKTNWVMQEYTVTEKYMNNQPDSRALYKVFLVDESSSVPLSKSQLLEKNMDDVAGTSADPILGDDDGDYLELDDLDIPLSRTPNGTDVGDYVSRARDDYLELNDLATPLSRTTSGTDSSCMSMTSEEYFDSEALMRDLGDDSGTHQVHFNLSVPAKLKEVVLKDANLGQTSKPGPTPQTEPSTSSSEETSSKEEKKDRVNRTKKRKVMKYLCFLAF